MLPGKAVSRTKLYLEPTTRWQSTGPVPGSHMGLQAEAPAGHAVPRSATALSALQRRSLGVMLCGGCDAGKEKGQKELSLAARKAI